MSNLQEIKSEIKKKKTLTNQQVGYFPYIWFKEKGQLHQGSPTSNKQVLEREN